MKYTKLTLMVLVIALAALLGACGGREYVQDVAGTVSETASETAPDLAADPNFGADPEPLATSTNIIDKILDKLDKGNIIFGAPSKMQLEKKKRVEVRLSPSKTPEQLESELSQTEQTNTAEIEVSNRMKAVLSGQGFTIREITNPVQLVSNGRTTTWLWDITPVSTGNQSLDLNISAMFVVSGQDTPFSLETFSKDINVFVTSGQRFSSFVDDNLEWLMTAILLPVFGLGWNYFRKNQQPQSEGVSSQNKEEEIPAGRS